MENSPKLPLFPHSSVMAMRPSVSCHLPDHFFSKDTHSGPELGHSKPCDAVTSSFPLPSVNSVLSGFDSARWLSLGREGENVSDGNAGSWARKQSLGECGCLERPAEGDQEATGRRCKGWFLELGHPAPHLPSQAGSKSAEAPATSLRPSDRCGSREGGEFGCWRPRCQVPQS